MPRAAGRSCRQVTTRAAPRALVNIAGQQVIAGGSSPLTESQPAGRGVSVSSARTRESPPGIAIHIAGSTTHKKAGRRVAGAPRPTNPPSLDTRNLIWGMSVHIRSPDSTSPFSLGFAQCFSTCLI